ncbi:MAG: ABC transporter permease [Acidobacteria bacterium]|nr:ABC transporter permease [Acidobacteriota bacterium]MBI3424469.1 ABC transporter permease [Acidobacteriota bacterium]
MRILWQDMRYGARMLLKNPGFTLIAVLTLALGIGANTAIFSVVNAVLLRPLPYPQAERLMMVNTTNLARGITNFGVALPDFREWARRNQSFERMAAYSTNSYNIAGAEAPERVVGAQVSADLFPTLGVGVAQGRGFASAEERYGKHRVAILSDELWRRRFGDNAQPNGQTLKLNGELFTVVGVAPRNFQFPDQTVKLWLPLAVADDSEYNTRGNYWLSVVARLKPGMSITQAQQDVDGIQHQIAHEVKSVGDFGASLVSLHEATVGNVQRALLVLLCAVACVLLIACANVTNLLLARAAARQREVAIRTTLGATRLRIVRQLLTESLLLSLLGGVCGLTLAWWGVDALIGLAPKLPRLAEVRVDGRVLAFTCGLALLTSLLFGLAPAAQAAKPDLNEALKEGGRGTAGSARSRRVRNVLVAAELALSLILLVSAGLMVNSLLRMQRVNPGFRTDHILTLQISLPLTKYPDDPGHLELAAGFFQQLVERVKALPGVQAAGVSSALPLTNSGWGKLFSIEDRPAPKALDKVPVVQYRQVSGDYFNTLGFALRKGRLLNERDTRDTLSVAVINEALARRYWPNEDPLGKRVWFGPPEDLIPPDLMPPNFDAKNFRFPRFTIVGIVGDVRHNSLLQNGRPEIYTPHTQSVIGKFPDTSRSMYLALRTTTDPLSLINAIRHAVLELDKEQPIADIATMEQLVATSLSQARLNTWLLALFALLALALAAVGVYGVTAYSVTQRTHEIGIRLALGASLGDLLKMIVWQGMVTALLGVGVGLAGSFALTRLLTALLFGVSATDPLTFGGLALLLALVALLACWIPARRATKVDPLIALRCE